MHFLKLTGLVIAQSMACVGLSQLILNSQLSYDGAAHLADNATAVAHDSQGNSYITGSTQYKYGSGIYSAIWTMKVASDGTTVWSKVGRAGLKGENDFPHAIAVDSLGNTYVAAEGNHTSASSQLLALKYDSAGNIQWDYLTAISPTLHNVGIGVGVDSKNAVYFGCNAGDPNVSNFALVKYSSGGVQQWLKELGPYGDSDTLQGMKVTPAGDVYLGGTSDPGTGHVNSEIVKVNSSGVQQWASAISNSLVSYVFGAFDVSSDGTVGVTGQISEGNRFFVAYVLNSGVFKWSSWLGSYGVSGYPVAVGTSVAMDASDSMYITGSTTVTGGYERGILIKFNAVGDDLWYNYLGSPSKQTRGTAVKLDAYGRLYLAYEDSSLGDSYRRAGLQIWDGTTNTLLSSNLWGSALSLDRAAALDVDASGRIALAGTQQTLPGTADMSLGLFTQTVVPINQAYSVKKGTTLTANAQQGVLSGAHYNISGHALLVSSPLHGQVTLHTDGSFVYTPSASYTGSDQFTFDVSQESFTGPKATVTITVTP